MTPEPATADGGRPLRADARRNRARLLAAAEAVFTAKGTSASTEEVAREAGVGIGTVFRHFPTKEALLEAVYVARLERFAEDTRLLSLGRQPGEALFAFFSRAVEQSAAKNALADALAEAGIDVRTASEGVGRKIQDQVGALLAAAQQAGAVRGDLDLPALLALLVGASHAAHYAGDDPDVRRRTLAVVLDGLRAQVS
ncbi:TetR/AcrR family transcriptional regulator [Streptacidiphilus griseoplanus]|uniref:TetR/AcrR family transcriptional regulator n=1 Tax=Peterkaempfera griseoplana TaxID=66896 RepID=UPI0006E422F7|nr:TetR/AcrR family transcriptional regulator [Peterkaempfera griseoplana]